MAGRLIGASDLTVCNCAGCGAILLGEKMAAMFSQGLYRTLATVPPPVARRLCERPYCAQCEKVFAPKHAA